MATTIEAEYDLATEWALATLEEMALVKSTSASRIRRQRDICAHMLRVCVTTGGTIPRVGRTWRMLADMAGGSAALDLLNKMIGTLRDGWTS